jgi:hypothetical protein
VHVRVDAPGKNELARGVDDRAPSHVSTYLDDLLSRYSNVSDKRLVSGRNPPVADHEIQFGHTSLLPAVSDERAIRCG